MCENQNLFEYIMNALCGKKEIKDTDILESSVKKVFCTDYEEYLKKPAAYRDEVVRSMYVGTPYENESPEKLREYLITEPWKKVA